ncbi:MAG: 30S ribosomal protein S6, partial [Rhodospirillaceae bacterium]|nr:30S ribosomal protein S6 [Rhodospirillaceae bacterium]
MPLYESVVIARQDISATQVDTLADELTKIIEENGGSVAKREHWGLRSLTFRIKKNRKGHYVLFNVDAPAAAVSEFERRMRLNEDVLRYLTIRVDEHEEGQSSILTNKGRPTGRREGGPGGGGGGGGGGRFESGRGRPPRDDNAGGNRTVPAPVPLAAPAPAP